MLISQQDHVLYNSTYDSMWSSNQLRVRQDESAGMSCNLILWVSQTYFTRPPCRHMLSLESYQLFFNVCLPQAMQSLCCPATITVHFDIVLSHKSYQVLCPRKLYIPGDVLWRGMAPVCFIIKSCQSQNQKPQHQLCISFSANHRG